MARHPQRPDRRVVELSGYALLPDGTTFDAKLLDLSYEGCKIRSEITLEPGAQLKLAVFRRGLIDAEVRWFKDGIAGLVFSKAEAPAQAHWPRRNQRVPVSADVTMRKPGQPNFRVRVLDASPSGCKVEFVDRPSENDRVWIKFDGLETMEAAVSWIEGFEMGLQFAKPIHPAVFDMLIARLGDDGP
jgi:hypothetical protein